MTATLASDLEQYLARNDQRARTELFDFLRIPSVSARSEHNGDIKRCADWVAAQLRTAGMKAEVLPTGGHPVVLGEWRGAGAGCTS